ncbi:hypothetical protein Back2_25650 [Nocardioides baekrokdamisoli]|uniref:Lipoprotein n=1 Tax=Nocardioides baekrokdamisoli TaxID=1804624 RepID=A0A3G9J3R8_9ACTN|nr:hypothetical protein [Nocardioides baekrokdamisoli]BBH18278.1 hypothetical protein Back2_25650 [Nocardioides baekrokdamisoli]
MSTHLRLVSTAAALVLVQACGSTPPSVSPSHPPSGAHGVISSPPVHISALHIEIRLELQRTTVTAGSALHGVLVVNNVGPKPLKTSCGFKFAVGLTNGQTTFEPAFTLECAINQSIPAGVTRYPVTVITTYGRCSQSGQPDGTMPGCLPGPMGAGSRFSVPPPLPTGIYKTAVVINGLPEQAVRLPAPVSVTLT